MERLIPISRKQHDAINGTIAKIREEQRSLEIAGNVILLGVEEDLGQVGIKDAVCKDGVYSLRIEIPDIAPKTDAEPVVQAS